MRRWAGRPVYVIQCYSTAHYAWDIITDNYELPVCTWEVPGKNNFNFVLHVRCMHEHTRTMRYIESKRA